MTMKPASEAVITSAINLIFQDIAAQNPNWCAVNSEPQPSSDIGIGLRSLDHQLKVIYKTLRTVESHFQSRISQIRKYRNKFSLIHRLPVEVFLGIFKHIAWDPFYYGTSYYQRLGSLSRVCTRWANIINQSPTLWSTIYTNNNRLLIDKIISRSGKCPLSIRTATPPAHKARQTMASFLSQVRPQVHRWKTVELALQNQDIDHLQEYLGDAFAPRLEKLRVSAVRLMGISARVDFFRGGVGRLEELDLSGISLPWASRLLSRLRALRLDSLEEGARATTARILTVLAQCPELTELQISNCKIQDSEAPDLPARLKLPYLRILSFRNVIPSRAPYSILSGISTPKYDQFCLDSHYATGSLSDNPLEDISHIVPSLVPLMASALGAVIHLDDYSCAYSVHSMELKTTLELYITHPSPPTVLGWITGVLGDAMKTTKTEVTIYHDSSPPDRDIPAISGIPVITALKLMGRKNQTPIIRHLSTTAIVNGKQQWPFPRLASLSIEEDANDPGEILDMVESRYGHTTQSQKTTSKARLPAPFTSFVINGSGKVMDDHTYRQIRKIVGDDNLRRDIEKDDEAEAEAEDYYGAVDRHYGPYYDDEAMSVSDDSYY